MRPGGFNPHKSDSKGQPSHPNQNQAALRALMQICFLLSGNALPGDRVTELSQRTFMFVTNLMHDVGPLTIFRLKSHRISHTMMTVENIFLPGIRSEFRVSDDDQTPHLAFHTLLDPLQPLRQLATINPIAAFAVLLLISRALQAAAAHSHQDHQHQSTP